jgi:hypothetical protein
MRIAHRRGKKPFVPGQPVFVGADWFGTGRIGAHIGPTLTLGHAHADQR